MINTGLVSHCGREEHDGQWCAARPALHGTLGGRSLEPEEDSAVPTEKQRRATAKRKLERQLERRAQQARRRRILTIAALAAVVVVVAGVAVWAVFFRKESTETSTASSTTTTSVSPTQDTAAPQAGVLPPFRPPADLGANCQYQPTPNEPAAKPANLPRSGKISTDPPNVSVSMMTNQGPIGIQLDNAKAPCTVNSFASLAGQKWFDNVKCHRETAGPELSVLQCGDPKGDGTGGPGYQFANEYPTNQYLSDDPEINNPILYPRGTLAMANAGPGTNGSQFFMVYKDSKLPPKYTVFGKIDQTGLATLDKIAAQGVVPFQDTTAPSKDVVITSVRLD